MSSQAVAAGCPLTPTGMVRELGLTTVLRVPLGLLGSGTTR